MTYSKNMLRGCISLLILWSFVSLAIAQQTVPSCTVDIHEVANEYPVSIAISADGHYIATGDSRGCIFISDAITGEIHTIIAAHPEFISDLDWSPVPGDNRLISSGRDKTVRLWDALTGDQLKLFVGHENYAYLISWIFDTERIVSVSYSHETNGFSPPELILWDINSGEILKKDHPGDSTDLIVSTDGQYLLIADIGGIDIRDTFNLDIVDILNTENESRFSRIVVRVVWDDDNQRILTARVDGTINIWDRTSGNRLVEIAGVDNFHEYERPYPMHTNMLAFSHDEQEIIALQADGTLTFYDANSGEMVEQSQVHVGGEIIYEAILAPDKSKILYVSDTIIPMVIDIAP